MTYLQISFLARRRWKIDCFKTQDERHKTISLKTNMKLLLQIRSMNSGNHHQRMLWLGKKIYISADWYLEKSLSTQYKGTQPAAKLHQVQICRSCEVFLVKHCCLWAVLAHAATELLATVSNTKPTSALVLFNTCLCFYNKLHKCSGWSELCVFHVWTHNLTYSKTKYCKNNRQFNENSYAWYTQ